MFEEIFHNLGQRDAMLLLSSVFFHGNDALDLYDLLPEELGDKMRENADALLEIPTKKRLPVLIHEMRRMMSFRGHHRLEGVEPSWLAAGFRGEKPQVIAIALMHMPSSVSRQLVARLPAAIRKALPPRSELRGVNMDIVRLVRARFDAKFAVMNVPRQLQQFGFREVLALDARELVALTRILGIEELACAFAAVGRRALAELLRRLPRENAEEIIGAIKKVTRRNAMEARNAQQFLARVLVNFENTDELFQKGGLYVLAQASVIESRPFCRQMCQRFPRAHGRLLEQYLAKAKQLGEHQQHHVLNMQDRVLDQVHELSARGKISPRYSRCEFLFHRDMEEEEEEED